MTSARTKTSDSVEATDQVSAETVDETSGDYKCDNHPQRKAVLYTQNGAIEQHLCEECTPAWYPRAAE